MNDSDKRTRLALAAAVMGPIAALALIRAALSVSGPASAAAEPLLHTGESLPIFEPAALENEQVLTRRFLDTYELAQIEGTPFLKPTAQVLDVDEFIEPDPEQVPIERIVDPPIVMLSSILGSGDRAVAVIDGNMMRIGDKMASGWVIQSIDGAGLRVILIHPDAAEPVVLEMNAPGRR